MSIPLRCRFGLHSWRYGIIGAAEGIRYGFICTLCGKWDKHSSIIRRNIRGKYDA